MNRNLIEKYFRDQCSEEELEQVLNWFQTEEGQDFLEQDMEQEFAQTLQGEAPFAYSNVKSERIFSDIQQHKIQHSDDKTGMTIRVASVLILVAILSSLLYWGNYLATEKQNPQPAAVTYVTGPGQENILTLSDGTRIRLNEQSTLTVPVKLQDGKRNVSLRGEAYFEVARDPLHPFIVNTSQSTVEVLGTKFNVKTDSIQNSVQVAVIEGKVALRRKGAGNRGGALLTKNHFGLLRLSDNQIIIEQTNTKNYLSWINKRLIFDGQSLEQISRQLERLYDVQITFEISRLKKLNLTANFEKGDIYQVLKIISNTLDINFTKNGSRVVWLD